MKTIIANKCNVEFVYCLERFELIVKDEANDLASKIMDSVIKNYSDEEFDKVYFMTKNFLHRIFDFKLYINKSADLEDSLKSQGLLEEVNKWDDLFCRVYDLETELLKLLSTAKKQRQ